MKNKQANISDNKQMSSCYLSRIHIYCFEDLTQAHKLKNIDKLDIFQTVTYLQILNLT